MNLQTFFYIVCFTPVPQTLQEDVESDGDQLASEGLVFNYIYTSLGQPKQYFYSNPFKRQKYVTVRIIIYAIPNLDIIIGPGKIILHSGKKLRSSAKPEITRQIPLKIMNIENVKVLNYNGRICILQHFYWMELYE